GQMELFANRVERMRSGAFQTEAEVQDQALASGKHILEDIARFLTQRAIESRRFRRQGTFVRQQVAEYVCPVFAHRRVERRRGGRAPKEVVQVLHRQVELGGQLVIRGVSSKALEQLIRGPSGSGQLLAEQDRDAYGAAPLSQRAGDRLANPPCCIRREAEAASPVEFLGGSDEPHVAVLDEVQQRKPVPLILF